MMPTIREIVDAPLPLAYACCHAPDKKGDATDNDVARDGSGIRTDLLWTGGNAHGGVRGQGYGRRERRGEGW